MTRGICALGDAGELTGIAETRNIVKTEAGAAVAGADGSLKAVDPESLVSMNFWGFFPDFMEVLESGFAAFLQELSGEGRMKGEYLLPEIVDGLMQRGEIRVSVLPSADRWFGVTYREDVPIVKSSLRERIDQGMYPEKLWG